MASATGFISPIIAKYHGVYSTLPPWSLNLLKRASDFFDFIDFLIFHSSPPARDGMNFKPVQSLVLGDLNISLTVPPTFQPRVAWLLRTNQW